MPPSTTADAVATRSSRYDPHNDVSFIDAFLTEDFVREHGMFTTTYDKRAKRWVHTDEFAHQAGALRRDPRGLLYVRANPTTGGITCPPPL